MTGETQTASQPSTSLRGLNQDFGAYYRPSDTELREAYANGIVALDANVLLDLYRLSPTARESLLGLLRRVSPRIFIPHQVALEFHRNRARAVAERRSEFESARAQLDDALSKAKGAVRHLATRAYGDAKRARTAEGELEAAFERAAAFVDTAAAEYDLDEDRIVGRTDEILDSLSGVLDGRVAPRPAGAELAADRKEAARRAEAKEPPGFRDGGKSENPDGDYLWWAETVRYAGANPSPVVIIGNDTTKGDWMLTMRGIRIGLAPTLAQEMFAATGHPVYVRTTSQFLEDGGRVLDVDISEAALNEARALPEGHRAGQLVPFVDVPTIVRLDRDELLEMQARGWLSKDDDYWPWAEVRRAAVLRIASRRGAEDSVLERISEFTRGPRPTAHNVLVVTAEDCLWVRSRDLEDYVSQLVEPPIIVIALRQIEGKMRMIQAVLERGRAGDGSED